MYDVLFFDKDSHYKVIASGLTKEAASELAQKEAKARGVGRMFLGGSASVPHRSAVLVIRSGPGA